MTDPELWAALHAAVGTGQPVPITLTERVDGAVQRYPLGPCVVLRVDRFGGYERATVQVVGEEGVRVVVRKLNVGER